MIKHILYLLVVIFFCVENLYSQDLWTIQAGVNLSSFKDKDDDIILNSSFGFQRKFFTDSKINISIGVIFTRQGGLLRNKPVLTYESTSYLYSYNFRAVIGYVELPFLAEYSLTYKSPNISLYAGPSFRLGMADKSEKYNKKLIYDYDHPERKSEFTDYNFKYMQGDYSNTLLRTTGWALNIGVKFDISIFELDVRYSNVLHNFGQFDQLRPVDKSTHTVHLLIGFKI